MPKKLLTEKQLERRDFETLKRFVRHQLGGYRVMLKNIMAGQTMFRGVQWAERPRAVAQLSYPPAESVRRWGRANPPGRSIFYASAAGPACFYEIKAQEGSHLALSEWAVTKPFWMHNLGYHEEALHKLGVKALGLREQLAHPIPGESKANARLRLQLSLSFTDEIPDDEKWNYRYKRPVAVFEQFFDRAGPLDLLPNGVSFRRAGGVVYPAMRLRGMADNLAIFPEFVEEALELKRVFWVLVEAADPSRSAYKLLIESQATSFSNGEIAWETPDRPAIDRQTRISLENQHWVMRNGRGQVYFKN